MKYGANICMRNRNSKNTQTVLLGAGLQKIAVAAVAAVMKQHEED